MRNILMVMIELMIGLETLLCADEMADSAESGRADPSEGSDQEEKGK